jgi:hypothetical protein
VRGWNENGIPGGEAKSVYTSSELQTLANQWELKQDEEDRASIRARNDFASPDSLPFDSGSVRTMIDEVISLLT